MNQDRNKLLLYITQVSFAIDDLLLFLDTHPCDRDALAYYQELKKARKESMDEYTHKYGPLLNDNVDNSCYWEWVKDPWPWE